MYIFILRKARNHQRVQIVRFFEDCGKFYLQILGCVCMGRAEKFGDKIYSLKISSHNIYIYSTT